MQTTAVIMAGGKGERFWPQSRVSSPKQFLSLTSDGKTMLQLTVERVLPTVKMGDIFIATNESYRETVQAQLPELPAENILCEPVAKNTAPCIAYAAAVVAARYGDAVMYVMPSDHIVKSQPLFTDTLRLAGEVAAENSNLVTLGITPGYPETGYGYICFEKREARPGVYPVQKFVEKPDLATAEQYITAGNYLWNSGMFIWKASTFLSNLQMHAPEVHNAADLIYRAEKNGAADKAAAVREAFAISPSISVDYAVMEHAKNIYTIPSSFGWDDVGSWLSLGRINELDEHGNLCLGNVLAQDCQDSILVSNKRLVTAVGLENIVLVETEDAIMLCEKDQTQRVKEIVQALKDKNMDEYL